MKHLNLQQGATRVSLEVIHTQNTVNIMWRYGQRLGGIEIDTAMSRGTSLLAAMAIAQIEATTALALADSNVNLYIPVWELDLVRSLKLIRNNRPETVGGITPLFDFDRQAGMVAVDWYGEQIILDLETANQHASDLIEIAEVAMTDLYLLSAFKQCGIGAELGDRVINSFRQFRSDQSINL
jgi:hypothetical protein